MSINLTDNKEKSSEVWKDVVGYEGLYQVSNLGRVKSIRTSMPTQKRRYCQEVPVMFP